jgi:hypothetical protein
MLRTVSFKGIVDVAVSSDSTFGYFAAGFSASRLEPNQFNHSKTQALKDGRNALIR